MVYRLIMLSDENDYFRREIRIDSEATFRELNDFILASLKYSPMELSTFYVCDDDWAKEKEVTLMDMGMGAGYDSYLMDETHLEDMIDHKGDRLLFVFDMLSERGFYIELAEIIPGERLEQPVVTLAEGKAPEQTSSLEFAETRSVGGGSGIFDDEELFADEELDLDDLDPEGFTDLDSLEGY